MSFAETSMGKEAARRFFSLSADRQDAIIQMMNPLERAELVLMLIEQADHIPPPKSKKRRKK